MAKYPSTLLPQNNDKEEIQKALLDLLAKINDLSSNSVQSGLVYQFAGAKIPIGWLLCDGSLVSRTDYSALFEVIGSTYGSGDGKNTFNLPDYRESYLVGIGKRLTGVTDHDVFTLSQFKDDMMQQITGTFQRGSNTELSVVSGKVSGAFIYAGSSLPSNPAYGNGSNNPGYSILGFDSSQSQNARTGNITRGKGIGINYIIKT
jgi:microcystin-dependent protein